MIETYDGGVVPRIPDNYPWSITIPIAGAFPSGGTWACQCRLTSDGAVLATATVTRVSDDEATISLTGVQTAAIWAAVAATATPDPDLPAILVGGPVTFDLVRTDVTPDTYTNIAFSVVATRPITRTGA